MNKFDADKYMALIDEFKITSESELFDHGVNIAQTEDVIKELESLGLIRITKKTINGCHFIVNKD